MARGRYQRRGDAAFGAVATLVVMGFLFITGLACYNWGFNKGVRAHERGTYEVYWHHEHVSGPRWDVRRVERPAPALVSEEDYEDRVTREVVEQVLLMLSEAEGGQ